MVIRNDIKDHGKLFINKMKEVKRKTSNDINNNYEDLLINPLVEEFINSLKIEDLIQNNLNEKVK